MVSSVSSLRGLRLHLTAILQSAYAQIADEKNSPKDNTFLNVVFIERGVLGIPMNTDPR